MVEQAIHEMDCPGLNTWMRRHVSTRIWKWKRLEAAGVPCSSDAFRIYRARFFWFLDKIERGEKTKAERRYNGN